MRFIVTGHKLVLSPVPETNQYLVREQGHPWQLDDSGQIKFEVKAVPRGHWIGSNSRRTMKFGHYGKPESYYRRRNTRKHLRTRVCQSSSP